MLGMNAHFAFGSVGIGVGNTDPAGPTHTVFDLLSPTLQAGASDCAGPGTYELHSTLYTAPSVPGHSGPAPGLVCVRVRHRGVSPLSTLRGSVGMANGGRVSMYDLVVMYTAPPACN